MKPPTLRPTGDKDHDGFQRDVREALINLKDEPIIGAVYKEKVSLTTTPAAVFHGLGRPWRYWEILDVDAAATIHRSSTLGLDAAKAIELTASAAVTVTIRFS